MEALRPTFVCMIEMLSLGIPVVRVPVMSAPKNHRFSLCTRSKLEDMNYYYILNISTFCCINIQSDLVP